MRLGDFPGQRRAPAVLFLSRLSFPGDIGGEVGLDGEVPIRDGAPACPNQQIAAAIEDAVQGPAFAIERMRVRTTNIRARQIRCAGNAGDRCGKARALRNAGIAVAAFEENRRAGGIVRQIDQA